jgi:NAD(P)H-hydrate repair Nnr-like enzyme with NAD(P)H-hydrate dehydratase domain
VGRALKRTDTPHQKEMRRLLEKLVDSLEENNRLRKQQIAGKRPDENGGIARPA